MIIVLTGATGTGKSAMAVSLAKKLGYVVINADAFQVYQELSIATAKPDKATREEVPHYLFDFVPLDQDYSVFRYQQDLRALLDKLQKEGKGAIIAGGTGLYVRAALFDYEFPDEKHVDMSSYEKMSEEELYQTLVSIDPEAAKEIHPHNHVRVLRAIEIYLSTGKKKSEIIESQSHAPIYDCHFFTLNRERAPLYERVNARVDEMFEMGLVEEDLALIKKYGRTPRAFSAIGVKELYPYIDGEISLEEAKENIKKNTRAYVKRQETFFRHQFESTWIENEDEILAFVKSKQS